MKVLGTGVLMWGRYERVGDRYGSVYLLAGNGHGAAVNEALKSGDGEKIAAALSGGDDEMVPLSTEGLEGKKGRLVAKILEVRESHHIGDMFRGLYPGGAEVGQEIELGEGTFFIETASEATPGVEGSVGLSPDDGREHDWLNPEALYMCHDQTVELRFEEG